MDNPTDFDKAVKWLKVIAEPTRLYLLEKIMEGVQCNCELGKERGSRPTLFPTIIGTEGIRAGQS